MPGSAAFLTPGTMFISSGVANEFKPLKVAFASALARGYKKFIEPASGAMAMCHVAQQAGWSPSSMEASDVIFFSAALGRSIMGQRIDDLLPVAEGFEHEDLGDPATALWVLSVMRAQARGEKTVFWQEVAVSMMLEKERHIAKIQSQLDRAKDVMGGMVYEPLDLWDHLERCFDDSNALVSLNPPSTGGGYEKFYDTQGKFTWAEPPYQIFMPAEGYAKLTDYMNNAKCLMAVYMENQGGHEVQGGVFMRGGGRKAPGDTLARSINYYVASNRPDEFIDLAGGMMVMGWQGWAIEPMDVRVLPENYAVTNDSVVGVRAISQAHASYYRSLWTHNFVGGGSGSSLGMFIDGHLAGVFGYDPAYVTSAGQFGGDSSSVLLQFGMTSPHKTLRLGRLLQRLALCRCTMRMCLKDIHMYRADTLTTAQLTKHPESKELRGIMKMKERKTDKQHGYRLIYTAPIVDSDWSTEFDIWLKDEERWQKQRKQAVSS
jgi:hypothetical protein